MNRDLQRKRFAFTGLPHCKFQSGSVKQSHNTLKGHSDLLKHLYIQFKAYNGGTKKAASTGDASLLVELHLLHLLNTLFCFVTPLFIGHGVAKSTVCAFRRVHTSCWSQTTKNLRETIAMKAFAWTCWRSLQNFSSSSIASGWLGMDCTAFPEPTEHGPAWSESSFPGFVQDVNLSQCLHSLQISYEPTKNHLTFLTHTHTSNQPVCSQVTYGKNGFRRFSISMSYAMLFFQQRLAFSFSLFHFFLKLVGDSFAVTSSLSCLNWP